MLVLFAAMVLPHAEHAESSRENARLKTYLFAIIAMPISPSSARRPFTLMKICRCFRDEPRLLYEASSVPACHKVTQHCFV